MRQFGDVKCLFFVTPSLAFASLPFNIGTVPMVISLATMGGQTDVAVDSRRQYPKADSRWLIVSYEQWIVDSGLSLSAPPHLGFSESDTHVGATTRPCPLTLQYASAAPAPPDYATPDNTLHPNFPQDQIHHPQKLCLIYKDSADLYWVVSVFLLLSNKFVKFCLSVRRWKPPDFSCQVRVCPHLRWSFLF